MNVVSGIPASSAQRTLDGYFDLSKLNARGLRPRTLGQSPAGGAKEFIIAPRDMGRMIYDFEEYDTQDEKDAMWGGY